MVSNQMQLNLNLDQSIGEYCIGCEYSLSFHYSLSEIQIWQPSDWTGFLYIQYVPGLSLQEEKKFFLILRKNFRGITFFASSETPTSIIKISVLIHCILKLTFFVQIWT
jgi:hypothetical protein